MVKESLILGGRAVREAGRTLDSLLPSMFIPLFFLVVNIRAGGCSPAATRRS